MCEGQKHSIFVFIIEQASYMGSILIWMYLDLHLCYGQYFHILCLPFQINIIFLYPATCWYEFSREKDDQSYFWFLQFQSNENMISNVLFLGSFWPEYDSQSK